MLHQRRLEESQKTKLKYGFRSEEWIIRQHGERKGKASMQRKKDMNLSLVCTFRRFTIKHLSIFAHIYPICINLAYATKSFLSHVRVVQDPELPEDPNAVLYFVMVELNVENIAELKRITQLEINGTLDSDGLAQFVEARSCLQVFAELSFEYRKFMSHVIFFSSPQPY